VKFEYLFFVVFACVAGNLAWRYLRSGSLTGAMLGGKIKREVGAIALESRHLSSHNLKVHAMESPNGESFVGLSLVSKAPLAVSMVPLKLTRANAQELVRLLQQAMA